jgi:DNA (cytosine-5)-methyltransferase 1
MASSISLFSGAGGLDLGLEAAGFNVRLCVENDEDCQRTLASNRPQWQLANPPDIFEIRPDDLLKQASIRRRSFDLLAGGPPCQPFSKAGYWHSGDSLRLLDPRAKTLHAYMKIVEKLLPRVILLENVEGIKFEKKDEGLSLLKRKLQEINRRNGTHYNPVVFAINAAEFGVPQTRKRIFLIAARDGKKFHPPLPTHGENRLPVITAWDAIGEFEEDADLTLQLTGTWTKLLPSIPEGKNYQWHTPRGGGRPIFGFRRRYWSFLLKLAKDKPSWTIQAQPGPSVGPFHWENRLLSARELARLQTFPDNYFIIGDRRAVQRQIGNAVPPLIGEIIGREIASQLLGEKPNSALLKFSIKRRRSCPEPEPITRIPRRYMSLIGNHPAHPGEGKGPGALSRGFVKAS